MLPHAAYMRRLKRPVNVFEDKWHVYDLRPKEKICLKEVMHSKPLSLHRSFIYDMASDSFEITYQKGSLMYSLFRSKSHEEAESVFRMIELNVRAIMKACSHLGRGKAARLLHHITDCCRQQDAWTAAHIAAHLRMHYLFSNRVAEVIEHLNAQSSQKGETPLHIALQVKDRKTVRAILKLNPSVRLINSQANSVLHEAAVTKPSIFRLIWTAVTADDPKMIEWRNSDNCTAIHLSCFSGNTAVVKMMLQYGLTINQMTVRPPGEETPPQQVHPDGGGGVCETGSQKIEFTKDMLSAMDETEMVLGGSPLHWVRSRDVLEQLLDAGLNVSASNFRQEKAIHVQARKKRLKVLLGIVADDSRTTSFTDEIGETALHSAVKAEDIPGVQALMVFDADIDAVSSLKQSARHLAASIKTQAGNVILYMLDSVGAKRCPEGLEGCQSGCAFDASFNGVGLPEWLTYERESFYNEILLKDTIKQALARQRRPESPDQEQQPSSSGVRKKKVNMLTLDGGGVRGLISCQILCEIDRLLKYPLFNYFDWAVGTSTGSVISSLLCLKHSPQDIRRTYFLFKDKIINGSKPYSSQKMDRFLKAGLGESTVMNALSNKKLVITSTMADRIPPMLFLFRSYPSPDEISSRMQAGQRGHPPSNCDKQYLWAACRASSAAPCYFDSYENFIDGGVISNNPTLDALTEFCNRNQTLHSQGMDEQMEELDVVLNIGTGRLPTRFDEKNCLLSFESPLFSWNPRKTYRNVRNFLSLLVVMLDQCTLTEFHVVERSMAWCRDLNIPHFRICPPLSHRVHMDDADDGRVVNFMYETKAYMHSLQSQLLELVQLLDSGQEPQKEDQEYVRLMLPRNLE